MVPFPYCSRKRGTPERRYAEIAPIIKNIVRRRLPWLLSRVERVVLSALEKPVVEDKTGESYQSG